MSFLTLKIHLKLKDEEKRMIDLLSKIAKNLYNATLYELRQQYFKTKSICDDYKIIKTMMNNLNHKMLEYKIANNVVRSAYKNMKKFIDGKSKIPKYKEKEGYFSLVISNVNVENNIVLIPISNVMKNGAIFNETSGDELLDKHIKESQLKKTVDVKIKIPPIINNKEIKEVEIKPFYDGYYYKCYFIYKENKEVIKNKNKEKMAIDLGINNLATCVTTSNQGFIICGRILKSVNRICNKKIAKYQEGMCDKTINNKVRKIRIYHYNFIEDYINKSARVIIKKALDLGVSKIIIGYNKGMKNMGINNVYMSKKNKAVINQNLTQIPLFRLKDKIKYNAYKEGIDCVEIDESYTSKASFYDHEKANSEELFKGKRVCRGIYLTSKGKKVNADINASFNILAKSENYDERVKALRDGDIPLVKRIQIYPKIKV